MCHCLIAHDLSGKASVHLLGYIEGNSSIGTHAEFLTAQDTHRYMLLLGPHVFHKFNYFYFPYHTWQEKSRISFIIKFMLSANHQFIYLIKKYAH